MKKIIILFFATTFAISVFSQGFGLTGGLVISNVMGSDKNQGDDNVKRSSRVSPTIGLVWKSGDSGIRFTTEVSYMQKGAKWNGKTEDLTLGAPAGIYEREIILNYFTFAATGNFHITDELYINLGPYLGMLTSFSEKGEITAGGITNKYNNSDEDDVAKYDFGANIGAGYWVNDLLNIDIKYALGVSSLDEDGDTSLQNIAIQIGVGYLFNY
tara:strand:+ start:230 stop:868 length:639 start_codon:yes stop_codon:yes gene_type:complete